MTPRDPTDEMTPEPQSATTTWRLRLFQAPDTLGVVFDVEDGHEDQFCHILSTGHLVHGHDEQCVM